MAELSQRDQLAFHEFSVRYRAGLAKKHAASQQKNLDAFKDAIREQHEQEQQASHGQAIEPPSAESEHQIEDPDEGR